MNDADVKLKAWKEQNGALRSPIYRIMLVDRDGTRNRTYNLGKCKDGNEAFYTTIEVEGKIQKLRRENSRNYDIYITPIDENHHYILVDDMTLETYQEFLNNGYEPCLVQESSRDNRQAILKIAKSSNEQSQANRVLKGINQKYGDQGISGVIHPFRMAGFSNKKPNKNNAFTQIIYSNHRLCSKTAELLTMIKAKKTMRQPKQEQERRVKEDAKRDEIIKTTEPNLVTTFQQIRQQKMRSTSDDSSLDFRACQDMFKLGYTDHQVLQALLAGSPSIIYRHINTLDYATRTIIHAKP
jgi:hypothetical protein